MNFSAATSVSDLDEIFEERNCCFMLANELKYKIFCQRNQPAAVYCESQWQSERRSLVWLTYRWLLALGYLLMNIASIRREKRPELWFIHTTDAGFCLSMLTVNYAAILTTVYFVNTALIPKSSCFLCFFNRMHHSATNVALCTIIMYWGCTSLDRQCHPKTVQNLVLSHFNAIAMLFDNMFVAFPSRVLHFIYPLFLSIFFIIFVAVYDSTHSVDAKKLRSECFAIDWMQPLIGLLVTFSVFCILICNSLLLFGLQRFRQWLHSRWHPEPAAQAPPSSVNWSASTQDKSLNSETPYYSVSLDEGRL